MILIREIALAQKPSVDRDKEFIWLLTKTLDLSKTIKGFPKFNQDRIQGYHGM